MSLTHTASGAAAGTSATIGQRETSPLFRVVIASSLGTVIEWYDFFLYASLAVFLSTQFFPPNNPTAALLLSVGALGTGYVLRPLGGLVFGAMGDRIGRKRTFVVTMLLMGVATVLIGALPTYSTIGMTAPIALVGLRMVQGLALGGEYGGAATYLAESAPPGRVGYATSWIQTTAGLGLILAAGINLGLQAGLGSATYYAWGWRVPFLLSALLVGLSTWIRLRLHESPVFAEMQRQGQLSASPIKASLTNRENLRTIVFTLFGVSAGTAAVSGVLFLYTGIFLQGILKADPVFATSGTVLGLVLGTPFFVIFGTLSDRIGRRRVILPGLVLNALAMLPIFVGLSRAVAAHDLTLLVCCVFAETVLFAAIYGPYGAFMAESFPARVRYTSLSLPFNLSFSLMGGLLPLVSLSLISATGNIYSGLAYPIGLLVMTIAVNLAWSPKAVGPTEMLGQP